MGSNARGSRIAEFDLHDQQKRFEASGKTAVLFCREAGIPVSTFYQRRAHWKKRVREGRTAITQRKAPFIDGKVSGSEGSAEFHLRSARSSRYKVHRQDQVLVRRAIVRSEGRASGVYKFVKITTERAATMVSVNLAIGRLARSVLVA